MASIQTIIVERIKILIHSEIRKYFRRQKDERRNIKGDLIECKNRLSKLEKDAEAKCKNVIKRCFDHIRTNGTALKSLQKKLGLSQKELAILLDSDPATVNRWESGKVKLSRRSVEKIAKIHSLSKAEAQQILRQKGSLDFVNAEEN